MDGFDEDAATQWELITLEHMAEPLQPHQPHQKGNAPEDVQFDPSPRAQDPIRSTLLQARVTKAT